MAMPRPDRARSGVCRGLDDATPEGAFEVAVGVEAERLEPGPLRLLRRAREQLAEIVQRRPELAVVRQRHVVDVGLRACDRVVIEALESCGDLLDLVVEPVVGDESVDVAVALRARAVEIVGDEKDLERAPAPDQPSYLGTTTSRTRSRGSRCRRRRR